jgi:rod shape-determining protein MreD
MLSFLAAWILMIIPMPHGWQWLRPQWLAMVILFWVFTPTSYVGVLEAWFAGLILDILSGAILGQYALAMVVMAFLADLFRTRARQRPLWQQTLIMTFLVGSGQVTALLAQWLIGHPPKTILYWGSTLTSMIIWPLVFRSLRVYERRIFN